MTTSIVLLLFVAGYAAIGLTTLDAASRAVPLLAALVTAVLIGIEIVKRLSAHATADTPAAESTASVGHELRVLGSVVAAVAGIYVAGFLVALPLYVALAIALIGRQPWRIAVATAAVTTAVIYVAFEVVLSYRLFAGVLFS
jgi:hypothetical protein